MQDTQNKTEEQRADNVGERQNAEQETKPACGCCGAKNKKQ
jgi:hypothetical protein